MKRTIRLHEDFVDNLIREDLLMHLDAEEDNYPLDPQIAMAMAIVYNYYSSPDQQLNFFVGIDRE